MNFLPYRKLTYNSPLSENEIRNRLNCLTRAANAFRVKYYPHIQTSDYQGDVYEHAFFLTRVVSYRNSFLPSIRGTTSPSANGTTVVVKMRFQLVVMIVGGIFGAGFFLATCITTFMRPQLFPSSAACGFGIFLLFITVGTILFGIEANVVKKDLARIFECHPEII